MSKTFSLGRVYLDASTEAQRRGDRRVSTEHILLATLADPDSQSARALGTDLATARAMLQRLDHEALAGDSPAMIASTGRSTPVSCCSENRDGGGNASR